MVPICSFRLIRYTAVYRHLGGSHFVLIESTRREQDIWECLCCYVAYDQTWRTRDPYEKIGFGEGRKPYKNIWLVTILQLSLRRNKVFDHVWLLYTTHHC